MIKKFIHIVIIMLFLAGICLWEELAVHSYLDNIELVCSKLQVMVMENENIDNESFISKVEQLEEFWKKKENTFCLILNHEEVEVIGVEIARMKASIINNDNKEFVISLSTIKFYTENLHNVLGLSIQNLI